MARTKLKTTVATAIAVLALGTATVTVTEIHDRGSGGRLRYLPDGGFIRLLSTAYSTNFNYKVSPAKPWQKALARRLPSAIASQFDGWMGNSGSMWMSGRPGETNLYVTTASECPITNIKELAMVVFVRQDNQSLAAFGASTIGNQDLKTYKFIQAWTVSAFPRRAKTVGLRFMEKPMKGNSWTTVAEFEIPNPAFRKYPVWTPEPLPQTSADGDLSVALTGFTTGLTLDDPALVEVVGDMPATRATFHVEMPGHPGQSWRPKSIEISDATGNKFTQYQRLTFNVHTNDTDIFTFDGQLWHSEAAWKLRVELSRVAGFDPSETWTVHGIPVPTAKQVIKLPDATTLGETKLNLVAITGAKAKQPGDMEWIVAENMVNISIRAKPWASGQRMSLVNVWDDRGRPVEIRQGEDWDGGDNAFGLVIPDGAKTLDFTFALHKSRFVEFLAAPEFVSKQP